MFDADQISDGVLVTSRARGHIVVIGTTVPTDASSGYAPGCLFIDIDSAVVYVNEGTKTSSDFDAVSTV